MFLLLLIVAGMTSLSAFWEFYLEDLLVPHIYEFYHPEPLYERWEYVVTTLVFTTLALIIPARLAFDSTKDADQAREALSRAYDELEHRVQDRTRELLDTNKMLENAIAEQAQTEAALRKSEKELRLLSTQLLAAQENERRRIALDLHDNVTQTLVAMKFRIEGALHESVDSALNPAEMSRILVPVVQETIEEVRNIYMRLRPSMLDELGLAATLTWLRRDFQDANPGVQVHSDDVIPDSEIADNLKIVIFRVVQEALDNVARHSKADQVLISLHRNNDDLELTIQDNGVGFNLEDVLSVDDSLRGEGLGGMRERIELVGGKISISSGDGEGATIRATMPVAQHQPA